MPDDFENFYGTLRKSIFPLSSITDFDAAYRNVLFANEKIEELERLLHVDDCRFEEELDAIWRRNRSAFAILPSLIAIGAYSNVYYIDETSIENSNEMTIKDRLKTLSEVKKLIKQTGLEELFKGRHISNLKDYLCGVCVGLDSNARKNRSGSIMNEYVRNILEANRISWTEYDGNIDLEIPEIQNKCVADYIVEANGEKFLIKANFYSTTGTTQTKKAELYSRKAEEIRSICEDHGYHFIWVTDGFGWHTRGAKEKLKNAYDALGIVYNLSTFEYFIKDLLRP